MTVVSPSLADLRRSYYGGGSAAEYNFLEQAFVNGITAASILAGGTIDEGYDDLLRSTDTNLVIPNAQIIVPAQPLPYWIMFNALAYHATAQGTVGLALEQDGVPLAGILKTEGFWASSTNNALGTIMMFKRLPAFAGADKTYTLRMRDVFGTLGLANISGNSSPTVLAAWR